MTEQPKYPHNHSEPQTPGAPYNPGHPDTAEEMYPGQHSPYTPPYDGIPPERQKIGMGVTAMSIGIIAVLTSLVPFLAIIFGVAAIIVGIIALRKNEGKGFGVAGIVTGGVGLVVSLAIGIFTIWVVNALSTEVEHATIDSDISNVLSDLDEEPDDPFEEPMDYSDDQTSNVEEFYDLD